jgi:hypothetical protein
MRRELAWLAVVLAVVLGGGGVLTLAHGTAALVIPLAVAEVIASVLLVVPRTRRLGALVLVGVLALASILHASFGEWPPPSFAVYAVALVVIARGSRP